MDYLVKVCHTRGMSIQTAGVIPTLTKGQRLLVAMEYADMKPEDMAVQLRVSATTVRNYLAERTKIDWAHLSLWADATGVDLAWLDTGATVPRSGVTAPVFGMDDGQSTAIGRVVLNAASRFRRKSPTSGAAAA